MKKILKYMASGDGRTVRFLGGSLITAMGLFVSPVLVVIGLLPFFTALFDVCLLAPMFKLPFEGEKLRDELE